MRGSWRPNNAEHSLFWPRRWIKTLFTHIHIRSTPKGIEDVSAYPYLFAELMGHGWSAEELTKLAGGNLIRVFSEVSQSRVELEVTNSPSAHKPCGGRMEIGSFCGLPSVLAFRFTPPTFWNCKPLSYLSHFYCFASLIHPIVTRQIFSFAGRTCPRYEADEQREAVRGYSQLPTATSNVGRATL